MQIKLQWYEVFMAATVGIKRQVEALKEKRPDRHGFTGLGWDVHVEGAVGELATAKALNRFWSGSINTFKDGGDVGTIQVRTRSKDYYDLIVRQDDADDDCFVLVVGTAPNYNVVGWIRGRDAKQEQWSKTHGDRPAAYFVPQANLRDLIELGKE